MRRRLGQKRRCRRTCPFPGHHKNRERCPRFAVGHARLKVVAPVIRVFDPGNGGLGLHRVCDVAARRGIVCARHVARYLPVPGATPALHVAASPTAETPCPRRSPHHHSVLGVPARPGRGLSGHAHLENAASVSRFHRVHPPPHAIGDAARGCQPVAVVPPPPWPCSRHRTPLDWSPGRSRHSGFGLRMKKGYARYLAHPYRLEYRYLYLNLCLYLACNTQQFRYCVTAMQLIQGVPK